MTRNLIVFALAAVLGLGCGSKTPPPTSPLPPDKTTTAPKDPPPEEVKKEEPPVAAGADGDTPLEAKAVAMMKQIGAIMAANGKDCGKLAAALTKFNADNKATLAELKAMDSKETPEQKKAFEKRHADDMQKLMGDMMPVMQTCGNDPEVQKAMKDMM